MSTFNHVPCNADDNVTVTCGTTEGMIASLLALLNPSEEVVIFEPFYENYGPDSILSGAKCKYVGLEEPGFKILRAQHTCISLRSEMQVCWARRTWLQD